MTCNVALKERYPRIDDPVEAINFALDHVHSTRWGRNADAGHDFLETWREGAWDEIEIAYPEFLQQVGLG